METLQGIDNNKYNFSFKLGNPIITFMGWDFSKSKWIIEKLLEKEIQILGLYSVSTNHLLNHWAHDMASVGSIILLGVQFHLDEDMDVEILVVHYQSLVCITPKYSQ